MYCISMALPLPAACVLNDNPVVAPGVVTMTAPPRVSDSWNLVDPFVVTI